jgi:hypothetical protein
MAVVALSMLSTNATCCAQSIVLKGDNWMIMVPEELTEVSCPNCPRGSTVTCLALQTNNVYSAGREGGHL